MRNYIILNNQRSDEISGLIIQELAPISKPLQRTQVETIDGRDGDIVTPLGYAAYDKKITIGLYGDFDINEIIAYFATQGTAIFSNEPDKYYNYQILDQIDYERLVRFRVATVTMHVQPFKYSATEGTLTIDASDTVSGEGSEIALDNTAEAPFDTLDLKGNAIQDGTPTPDSPVDIQVVTGEQTVKITGKNLFDISKVITNGTSVVNNGNGTLTINTPSASSSVAAADPHKLSDYCPTLRAGDTATFSMTTTGTSKYIYLYGTGANVLWGDRNAKVITQDLLNASVLWFASGVSTTATISDIQIELGNTATAYEPYQGQKYKLNLGKNLFNSFGENSGAITVEADGSIKISGVISANGYCSMGKTLAELAPTLKVGDTVYLYLETDWSGKSIYIAHGGYWQNGVAKTITQDMLNDTVIVYGGYQTTTTIKIMMTKTLDTDYAPYFTPIELAAIGDYADEPVKVGDTWYIRRKIGKVVFDGSADEAWTQSTVSGQIYWYVGISDSMNYSRTDSSLMSNSFTHHGENDANGFYMNAHNLVIFNHGLSATTVDAWKTWLASNPTTVYYALAEPTDEEIADQDLIDALDEFYGQAHSYKGYTHITATAQGDNAPAILSVEVNENNESTIVNSGNTTSRPIITIYGQGDIGMYINDVQVLDIALGDEQYITIDSVAMEAYKGTTANLKNRLVTGDYSKLALNAGDNKIYFTGNVTKYEISKYSRWL